MGMGVSGGSGGGRRGRRRGRKQPMSEINVTPLVDVMLVLLIVFMVAAPLLTVGVPIDLPQSQAKSLNTESEPVTVTITADGQIYVLEELVDRSNLLAKLDEVAVNGTEERIFVRGDNVADYGAVMQVMGQLSGAGYSKIGLITEQEQSQ
ncbi:biopolymer transport protein TolR [Maritalea mobilis]|uniref:Biopolymer transport protein TolR n=1 Tax=Maritalea mobilis TaxID=483324 RepID=A0A4R6VXP1_9HYPH|nr:protein TolR [Maritalea mobilis]TDQ67350.1 biopolymer transport protein TolR [Maritalea mobilis]